MIYIQPFGILCLSAIRMMCVKIILTVCMLVGIVVCVFGKLCAVGFLVVCKCSSVLLQSAVISYVDCGDDG